MLPTRGYAVKNANAKFEPFNFERRDLKPNDVLIKILYCGICHSDIHQAHDEWGRGIFPMIPGHEIAGLVEKIGTNVTRFKVGDKVGVGCFVDSCRECQDCKDEEQQFCKIHCAYTYNGTEMDLKTPTFGGYSSQIVVDENYVLRISHANNLAEVAPLLCAGITTYSPLRRFNIGPDKKVGVIGLGGLGHMAVKLAAAMGAEVTVLSTSKQKEQDAKKLGAHNFVLTTEPNNLVPLANKLDFILDTVSAPHPLDLYLNLLNKGGTLVMVGVSPSPLEFQANSIISNRRQIAGSLIGGLRETQEMLDYCAQKNIVSNIELIPIQKIEEAYDRTLKGDVRYRFVIDLSTL